MNKFTEMCLYYLKNFMKKAFVSKAFSFAYELFLAGIGFKYLLSNSSADFAGIPGCQIAVVPLYKIYADFLCDFILHVVKSCVVSCHFSIPPIYIRDIIFVRSYQVMHSFHLYILEKRFQGKYGCLCVLRKYIKNVVFG